MVNKLHIDPLGATRQLGKRGALKQATFIQLKKNAELLSVESPFEVLLLSWRTCLMPSYRLITSRSR